MLTCIWIDIASSDRHWLQQRDLNLSFNLVPKITGQGGCGPLTGDGLVQITRSQVQGSLAAEAMGLRGAAGH